MRGALLRLAHKTLPDANAASLGLLTEEYVQGYAGISPSTIPPKQGMSKMLLLLIAIITITMTITITIITTTIFVIITKEDWPSSQGVLSWKPFSILSFSFTLALQGALG